MIQLIVPFDHIRKIKQVKERKQTLTSSITVPNCVSLIHLIEFLTSFSFVWIGTSGGLLFSCIFFFSIKNVIYQFIYFFIYYNFLMNTNEFEWNITGELTPKI